MIPPRPGKPLMKNALSASVVFTLACLLCSGCTTRVTPLITTGQSGMPDLPAPQPGYDHYIAWIPGRQAENPTVARTLTHIALGNARRQTGDELCGGTSLISGEIADETGPIAIRNPDSPGYGPVWYYRISRQPGLGGCDLASQERLYQALQQHLPTWIRLETAATNVMPAPALLGSAQ
jgi:hypothetical protein